MQPLSTFNMVNVIGTASPGGLSLSTDSQRKSLEVRIAADEYFGSSKNDDTLTADIASISDQAKEMAARAESAGLSSEELEEYAEIAQQVEDDEDIQQARKNLATIRIGEKVSQDLMDNTDKERIRDLEERDRKVRQREEAHVRAAGLLASGGPKYRYEIGPDGKRYAVEGHTDIKVKEGNTPEERLKNAKQAERAAQQGGAVTPQSAKVLAEARGEAQKAQQEIETEQKGEEQESSSSQPLVDRFAQKVADTYRQQDDIPFHKQTLKLD